MMLTTGTSTDLQGRGIKLTNEWLEFKAYTDDPVFSAENKQSTAFIGRFTVRMIKQNKKSSLNRFSNEMGSFDVLFKCIN